MSFRRAWKFCGWCTLQGSRACLLTLWLLLLAALAGQIHLISSRRVPVPEPLRRLVAERLAEHGIKFDYGRARMDFAGRLLLEDVSIGDASDSPAPRATARTAYVRVNPWLLVMGTIDPREIKISGLDLHLPEDEGSPLMHDIDLSLSFDGDKARLNSLIGYVGTAPLVVDGDFTLPHRKTDPAPPPLSLSAYYQRHISTTVVRIREGLSSVENPRLHIRLNSRPAGVIQAEVDLQCAAVALSALPVGTEGRAVGLNLQAALAMKGPSLVTARVSGTLDSMELPARVHAHRIAFQTRGSASLAGTGQSLALQIAGITQDSHATGPLALSLTRESADLLAADVSVQVAGSPWRIQSTASPLAQTARVELEGFVDDAMLSFVGSLIKVDLTALLDPAQPAPLHAVAILDPGWKLRNATGRLHSGFVRVGTVNLAETGTEFSYDGTRVVCDNLVLRLGDSLALGSYEMNAQTMDFRFLLTGSLRPVGISGWFHSWWSNFWATFDFTTAAPLADVDVQGRWGDSTATRVFVTAEGRGTGLKGVPFDLVRTRLFLRPHWFDIRHFEVSRGGQDAVGSLSRSLDLSLDTWRYMEFDVQSRLPLETISALFKAESEELLSPYRFPSPPHLTLKGRVDSKTSPAGEHQHIDIGLTSSGPMTYHGFPLSDLAVTARMRDDELDLPSLRTGFAGGIASGHARLWSPEPNRRLAFDIKLQGARLGAATDAVAALQPAPAKPLTEKNRQEARLLRERMDQSQLNLSLTATGLYADFLSFQGKGRADITGAGLGQLNLFGPLSQMLGGTFINLGSFSLNTVEAPFELQADRLRFTNLRVTGPSAQIQAKGDYLLPGGRMDFTAKVRPFESSDSAVGSAVNFVLTPFSSVFEVKVTGSLSDPAWIFNYGPSRLLNSITGNDKPSSPPAPPVSQP